jgi:hypothetical protein
MAIFPACPDGEVATTSSVTRWCQVSRSVAEYPEQGLNENCNCEKRYFTGFIHLVSVNRLKDKD